MYIPKRYGQSKRTDCPFCGKIATTQNKQKLPVCSDHKTVSLDEFKCMCGKYLELKSGKWGPYFNCMNCGNINFNKAMNSRNEHKSQREGFKPVYKIQKKSKPMAKKIVPSKKEVTISSDELDIYYA